MEAPQLLVPADSANLGYTEPALEETRNGLVSKIMKSKIRHLGAATETLEG